ncbi:HAD-superfamily hydrolase, subfamily IB, PSPase-like [Trema orientale]|uniref:HAD-superfamily hydrolase, subfamily IB, PSPase-like n=1 Tax=Trema orientale TaxID=63057 RepID=A0A2P5EKZ0_TREOI|nr:HAD-superfamily hydrolase, subfamily IB, PSPase-like [Trema orientale]
MRASLSAQGKKRFIYVGDGRPDFCAGLKLEEGDYLLPRKDFPIWELICTNQSPVKPKIQAWTNWEELQTVLLSRVNTLFLAEKLTVPDHCKFQDSSISAHSNALPVPH